MFFKMEHCDVYYGQIQALYDINVEINPGEIISIIGANGAGKTTLMKYVRSMFFGYLRGDWHGYFRQYGYPPGRRKRVQNRPQ